MPNLLIADDHPLCRAALRGAAAVAVAQLTVREAESLDGVIATLEAHDDSDLVLLDREPLFLFPELAARGHEWAGNVAPDGAAYRLLVRSGGPEGEADHG